MKSIPSHLRCVRVGIYNNWHLVKTPRHATHIVSGIVTDNIGQDFYSTTCLRSGQNELVQVSLITNPRGGRRENAGRKKSPNPSAKFQLRIPPELKSSMDAAADVAGDSLAQWLLDAGREKLHRG